MTRLSLFSGADLTDQDTYGMTPLRLAVEEILMEKEEFVFTPLMAAIMNKNEKMVEFTTWSRIR